MKRQFPTDHKHLGFGKSRLSYYVEDERGNKELRHSYTVNSSRRNCSIGLLFAVLALVCSVIGLFI